MQATRSELALLLLNTQSITHRRVLYIKVLEFPIAKFNLKMSLDLAHLFHEMEILNSVVVRETASLDENKRCY